MRTIDLSKKWIAQAQVMVEANYSEEYSVVNQLPHEINIPPLEVLFENGMGVAVVEGERLLGFLSAYGPWKPAFCTPDTVGVFSPLHAHAVQRENRQKIWRMLYQAAARKWVSHGASSHAITLYAHDSEAKDALFMYGFGVRCVDLMRDMGEIRAANVCECVELTDSSIPDLTTLRRLLVNHLAESPCFMKHDPNWVNEWLVQKAKSDVRVFAAKADKKIVAYIEAQKEGENFVSDSANTMNICGAYCLPEYRGRGIVQSLLQRMIETFSREGYQYLGVDCESINPCAFSFWSKYFNAYTYSVVRRIDENAVR